MSSVRRLLAAAAALLTALAASPATGQKPTGESGLPSVTTFALENGLEVAHARMSRVPLVSVQVWIRAGSKDEKPDRRGTARLLQALMFEGSERARPGDHARIIREVGGFTRALTSEDATYFENTLPREHLELALALEAERMQRLVLREEALEPLRRGLRAELRQQEGGPLARGFSRFLEEVFTRHPYRWTAAGVSADVEKITLPDLEAFYRQNYAPNNALLVVVGDVTAEAVKAAVDKHFGALPRRPDPPRPAAALAEPGQDRARRVVGPPGNVGFVIVGYRIPPARHEDVNALQLLSVVMTAGEESRLGKRLLGSGARQAGGQAIVREDPGILFGLASYHKPGLAEQVEKALLAEFERVRTAPPTAAEVERARTGILANLLFNMESVSGYAGHIGQSWILTSDAAHFTRDLREFETLTPADLKRVADRYLVETARTVVVVPMGGAR